MSRVRLLIVLLLPHLLACAEALDPGTPSAEPTGRVQDASARNAQTPLPARTLGALPTAIRVFAAEPDQIVLRPADLPTGFRQTSDHPVVAVELSRGILGDAPSSLRQPVGSGRHVVLVRDLGAATDGIVSVATTTVRYETTVAAAAAFTRAAMAVPGARPYVPAAAPAGLGDEVRTWRYGIGGARVEEVLFRARNYVLGVTVVASAGSLASTPGLEYAQLVRAKLPF